MHDVYTYPGEYSSGFAMFCLLPPSRQKRSIDNDIIGSGYYISVSNNGQDFTEELTTIVYDSTCYDCNLTSLTCDELVSFTFYICYLSEIMWRNKTGRVCIVTREFNLIILVYLSKDHVNICHFLETFVGRSF
jgi:hypothetical protein